MHADIAEDGIKLAYAKAVVAACAGNDTAAAVAGAALAQGLALLPMAAFAKLAARYARSPDELKAVAPAVGTLNSRRPSNKNIIAKAVPFLDKVRNWLVAAERRKPLSQKKMALYNVLFGVTAATKDAVTWKPTDEEPWTQEDTESFGPFGDIDAMVGKYRKKKKGRTVPPPIALFWLPPNVKAVEKEHFEALVRAITHMSLSQTQKALINNSVALVELQDVTPTGTLVGALFGRMFAKNELGTSKVNEVSAPCVEMPTTWSDAQWEKGPQTNAKKMKKIFQNHPAYQAGVVDAPNDMIMPKVLQLQSTNRTSAAAAVVKAQTFVLEAFVARGRAAQGPTMGFHKGLGMLLMLYNWSVLSTKDVAAVILVVLSGDGSGIRLSAHYHYWYKFQRMFRTFATTAYPGFSDLLEPTRKDLSTKFGVFAPSNTLNAKLPPWVPTFRPKPSDDGTTTAMATTANEELTSMVVMGLDMVPAATEREKAAIWKAAEKFKSFGTASSLISRGAVSRQMTMLRLLPTPADIGSFLAAWVRRVYPLPLNGGGTLNETATEMT